MNERLRHFRRFWRHYCPFRWWFLYVWPQEKCRSCGVRDGHEDWCYFA